MARSKAEIASGEASQSQGEALSPRALVVDTCRAVASDPDAPAAARIAAARLMAELLGLVGRIQAAAIDAGEGAYSEMSAAEIDRQIALLAKKG